MNLINIWNSLQGIDGKEGIDPKTFIVRIKPNVLKLIRGKEKPSKVKFNFVFNFTKEDPATRQIDTNSGNFSKKPVIVSNTTNLSELYNTLTEKFLESIENFQNEGSGWQFKEVVSFSTSIDPYNPLDL